MAAKSSAPSSLFSDKSARQRVLQHEQAMVQALKDKRFEDALQSARTVLEIDPNRATTKQFVALLEEKLSLDDTDTEEEGEGTPGGEAGAAAEEGSSEEESDDDDDDEEEDSEDEDEDEEDESEEESEAPTGPPTIQGVTDGVEALVLAPGAMKLNKAQRGKLRDGLARSIQGLKQKELAKKLVEDDPLLGA